MSLLILVDLENVENEWNRKGQPRVFCVPGPGGNGVIDHEGLADLPAEAGWATPREATVVFAFNDNSPDDFGITYAGLWRFARRLAQKFNATLSHDHMEVALVRTVPQAADVALIRLLREAPDGGVTQFDRVVVAARDLGLKDCVTRVLPRWMSAGGGLYRVWSPPAGDAHHERSATAPVAGDHPAPIALGPGWGARVTDPATVAWAQRMQVQTPQGADIKDIARVVSGRVNGRPPLPPRPGLLTQVGLSTTSVRGAGRMPWTPVGGARAPLLSPLGPADGVEIHTEGPAPHGDVKKIESSTVGEGACWVEACDAQGNLTKGSVFTQLPSTIHAALADAVPLHGAVRHGRLCDLDLLAKLERHPTDPGSVTVCWEHGPGDVLTCQVDREPWAQPAAWWMFWGSDRPQTKSERRLDGWTRTRWVGPPRALVSAQPAHDVDDLLVLRAHVAAGVLLESPVLIPHGGIGRAVSPDGCEHLILALWRPIQRGQLRGWRHISELESLHIAVGCPEIATWIRTLRTLPLLIESQT
jgi:hypothetical protein